MKTVNYNLRSLSPGKETSILLLLQYGGTRLRMSCSEKIKVEDWDKLTQRALKSNTDAYQALNERLDLIEHFVNITLQKHLEQQSSPSIAVLKKEIESFIFQLHNVNKTNFFWEKYKEFIAYKKKTTSSSKEYEYSLKNHLKLVEKKIGIPLTFEAFQYSEAGYMELFRSYLTYEALNKKGEKGLTVNTIWKHFKNIRVFLNWCFDQNYVSKFSTKHIQTKNEQIYNVYLTKKELEKLEDLPLTGESKVVRDLFLISCETGLRFSDLCELITPPVNSEQLEIFPKKTRKNTTSRKIIIPFSSRVKRILKTNDGFFPSYKYTHINRYNTILRTLCKQAGMEELSFFYRIVQGKEIKIESKKYALVSSHTGRRTFCTLKFLDGMPVHAIMKFSGHTSEQNFLRYLKLDAELTAERYKDFFE